MKSYKSLLFAAVVAMGGIFTSCSEQSSYSTYDSSKVAYSFNNKVANYTFMPDDVIEDINIAITRNSAGAELTLPVHAVFSDEEIVTGSQSVTFEQGSNVANYTIHMVRDLELGEQATVQISIDPDKLGIPVVEEPSELEEGADSAAIAQHAKDSLAYATYLAKLADYKLSTTVTIMRDYSWTSLGQATFRDDAMASLYGAEIVVCQAEMQECDQVPGYYRLVNPYGENYPYNEDGDWDKDNDYYLYVHAEDPEFVYILPQTLGVNWGDGEFTLMDGAGYFISVGNSPAVVKNAGYGGTLVDGVMTWAVKDMFCGFDGARSYYANNNGLFYIAMPGIKVKSYKAEVSYKGIFLAPDGTTEVLGNLSVTGDAKKALVAIRPASDDPTAVADAILEGEIEAVELESGDFQLPFDAKELGSEMQVVAVVIDDEEVQAVAKFRFEYNVGGDDWEDLGTGLYTDDALITLFYNVPAPQYEVLIQESSSKPGMYRLVNPYTDGVYAYESSQIGKPLAPEGTHMIVNAVDPQAVYVPETALGIDWGYGEISLCSAGYDYLAYYGDDYYDLLKERGYFGKLEDGVISFPKLKGESQSGETYVYQFTIYLGEDGYDNGEEVQIVLPKAASASRRKAAQFSRNLVKYSAATIMAHKNTGKARIAKARMLNKSLLVK